jgi:hypothetical protein
VTYHDVICIVAILVSGIAIVILLTRSRSIGCFTEQLAERIELSNAGVRSSEELTRQWTERLRQTIVESMEQDKITQESTFAVLANLRTIRNEMKSQYHPERSA